MPPAVDTSAGAFSCAYYHITNIAKIIGEFLLKNDSMFIAFEGIDGSGKTTQAKLLTDRLTQSNIPHILTREPGSTEHGKLLLEALLRNGIDPMAELLIFCADRAQHYRDVINPALAKGEWVISDRSLFSTIVYNGYGMGMDLDLIKRIHQAIAVPPDLVIWLDVPLQIARENRENRGSLDRLDRRSDEFLSRVQKGYEESLSGKKCLRISEWGAIEDIHQRILSLIHI